MTKPISEYRQLFPVTREYAYLNHAACSAMPRPGLDALDRYWEAQSTRGSLTIQEDFQVVQGAREKVARLIGADPSEVGWVLNTSIGINIVANGLDWQRGDNVVTVQGEFPANVYPWMVLRSQGVETRLVQQRDNRVLVDDIAAAMDGNTRALSISFVEFSTGFRNDLRALGRLCKERGVLFNVDAIQGLGALELSVEDAGISFLQAGTHKWLMGPQGLGVLYINKDALEQLRPVTANWFSVAVPFDFFNYEQPWVKSASRIEGSTPNMAGVVAFDAVLDLLLEVEVRRIEARVLELTDRLMDGLLSRGYEVVSSPVPEERSGIVCFKARGDPEELLAQLEAEKVVVAVRAGIVRASPHFYNTEEEIDRLLALL